MPGFDINLVSVLIAAVITFGFGALWYSPVMFGEVWLKYQGYTPKKMKALRKTAGRAYAASVTTTVVMAIVLSILITYAGVASAAQGVWLGLLAWVGFAMPIGLTANMYSDKPIGAFFVDSGYQLAYLLFMGGFLAAWR